jgi:hypothetical protein
MLLALVDSAVTPNTLKVKMASGGACEPDGPDGDPDPHAANANALLVTRMRVVDKNGDLLLIVSDYTPEISGE